MKDWSDIKFRVLDDIKPLKEQEKTLNKVGQKIVNQINSVLKKTGINGNAEIHGSVAHGTWIKGQNDLDIFIVLDNYQNREQLERVLEEIRKNTPWELTEAWAEHPYLQTIIDEIRVDIVPCFKVTKGEKIKSATDRTPLHTSWLRENLHNKTDEVRLLKQFLIVSDLYGAEIRVGGFSGYLCELLIIKYGSFEALIENSSEWIEKKVIKFNNETREFSDPLIVYDPVDNNRNVASALRLESFKRFISASKMFIKNPSMRFFTIDKSQVNIESLIEKINDKKIVFIVIEETKAEVPDTLWGQLRKSSSAIEKELKNLGFDVNKSLIWSNEKTRHIFCFKLSSLNRPREYKHLGPPQFI